MPKLAVNVDHIATIREARKTNEPDPVTAASAVELAGAHGVVVHLRQDRRHIQERDLELILRTVRLPVNLEMAATPEMIGIALQYRPHTVTLVPEDPNEVTTQGGLNIQHQPDYYREAVRELKTGIAEISLFIDPDPDSIRSAADMGVDSVELHTGAFAEATVPSERDRELERLRICTRLAHENHLQVRAGHGLTYINVSPIARLPYVFELSIGHSIVSRSVLVGMYQAVTDMLNRIAAPRE